MNSSEKSSVLGILGGLGPMSGIYFCEMLTSHTNAVCDAEHINFLMSSRADTPDRSSFILGKSNADPSPIMAREAKKLEAAGADIIAIPCNTAHHFYDTICSSVDIPILNIIKETARFCKHSRLTHVGVLATEGTLASGAYSDIFSPLGMQVEQLSSDEQAVVTDLIFNQIKKGISPNLSAFWELCDKLCARGCQKIILGCTELSLIKKQYKLSEVFVDSLELLALASICACGKEPVGFESQIMNFYGDTEKGIK